MTDLKQTGPSSHVFEECKGSVETLYQYLDGWLDPAEAAEIRGHIEACGDCEDVYRFQTELRTLIATRCHSEVPDAIRQRVLAAIDNCS